MAITVEHHYLAGVRVHDHQSMTSAELRLGHILGGEHGRGILHIEFGNFYGDYACLTMQKHFEDLILLWKSYEWNHKVRVAHRVTCCVFVMFINQLQAEDLTDHVNLNCSALVTYVLYHNIIDGSTRAYGRLESLLKKMRGKCAKKAQGSCLQEESIQEPSSPCKWQNYT